MPNRVVQFSRRSMPVFLRIFRYSVGEGPSSYQPKSNQGTSSMGGQSSAAQEYGGNDYGFQSAINSHVIEHM
jgi:hypothetical protein